MKKNRVYITSSGVIIGMQDDNIHKDFKIKPEQYEPLLKNFQTRNIDRISKISIAAAAMTLAKAGINIEKDSINDYMMILGTQYSALESIHNYDMEALKNGALAVNPGLFPNTVLNSPACQVSIQFSIAGPVYTVCNGLTSSLDSIGMGYNFIRVGLSSMVLAGGVDENAELQILMKNSDKGLGEAGGFLMLESEKTITDNKKLAEVVGYKSQALNREQRVSLTETIASLIIDTAEYAGDSYCKISNMSLSSDFALQESEKLLDDICKKMNYNNSREYIETDWMGTCGIVQANKALIDINTNNKKNAMWVLINTDKDKVAVLILKGI